MGLKKGFYKDSKWFSMGSFSTSKFFSKITHRILYYTLWLFNKHCFTCTMREEEMPAGVSHSSSCSASRFVSPCPARFMSPPEGAVKHCHPFQSPLGKPWYPCLSSERVDLHAGEYKAKFHTSIWSFQTLTSAKAAPLSQLWFDSQVFKAGKDH